jgi:hypothetical protein
MVRFLGGQENTFTIYFNLQRLLHMLHLPTLIGHSQNLRATSTQVLRLAETVVERDAGQREYTGLFVVSIHLCGVLDKRLIVY